MPNSWIQRLIRSRFVNGYLEVLPLLSYSVSSIIIFIILSNFFKASYLTSLLIFIIGLISFFLIFNFFTCIRLIKMVMSSIYFFLDTIIINLLAVNLLKLALFPITIALLYDNRGNIPNQLSTAYSLLMRIKRGIGNLINVITWDNIKRYSFYPTALLKALFFNIFNDIFFSLIYWLILLSGLYYVRSSLFNPGLFDDQNLTNFVGIITLLGVIAGIFQYYVKTHKEDIVPKITQIIQKFSAEHSKYYTFFKFREFIKADTYHDLNEKVEEYMEGNDIKAFIGLSRLRRMRGAQKVQVVQKYSIEPDSLFYVLEGVEDLKNAGLTTAYKDFITHNNQIVKNEIDQMNLDYIRNVLISEFSFFNDLYIDSTRYVTEAINEANEEVAPDGGVENVSFIELYAEARNNNTEYLLTKALNLNGSLLQHIVDVFLSTHD